MTDNTIELLPNGYDPELIESISTIIPSNQVLSIGFIGTIYKWHPVESVLNVLDNYVKTKGSDCLRLSFVGINNLQEIEKLIGSNFNNLKEIITLEPKMSNEKILNKAAQFDVLLLFNDFSIIGTKIYDYLGLKRPILFCYSEDESSIKLMNKYFIEKFGKSVKLNVQEQLIRKKNAGFIIKNSEQLILILDSIIEEHKKTGSVKCHTIDSEEFSRRNQTKKLAELIHEIV